MALEFAVIGLGQFGKAIALHLAQDGHSVLAVDREAVLVERLAPEVDAAVQADATDEEALTEMRLHRFAAVVVTIGAEHLEASILATALLRQLGVSRIVARSTNDLHARVLFAVGAHEVIDPEQEMGLRLARRLSEPGIVDQIQLGEASVAEVAAPAAFFGETLGSLHIRNRYDLNVLAIRRSAGVVSTPGAKEIIHEGDILVVLGPTDRTRALALLS